MRFFTWIVPLLSFSLLEFEIILTRLFGYMLPYHFTAIAVSFALLGLGLGAYVRIRTLSGVELSRLQGRGLLILGLSFLLVYASALVFSSSLVLLLFSLGPFLVGGALLSQWYEAAKAQHAQKSYFLDLTGAALACLLSSLMVETLGPAGIVFLLVGLCGAGSLSFLWAQSRKERLLGGSLAILALAVTALLGTDTITDGLSYTTMGSRKPMATVLRQDGGRITDHAWSMIGRADLYEDPRFPNVRWIYNDRTNSTMLVRDPSTRGRAKFLQGQFAFFPYALFRPRRVLVLGSGAGLEVHMAGLAGADQITAVEVNPAIVSLVQRQKEFSGAVYEKPGIRLHVEEGRRFLIRDQTGPYDLIQMSLVLTATASTGTYALVESYLYTVEAFRLYLDRLAPEGTLALIDDSSERILRQSLTAALVLQSRGIAPERSMDHLCVLENPEQELTGYRYLLLVSPSPFSPEMLRRIQEMASQKSLLAHWIPDRASRDPYRSWKDMGMEGFVKSHPLKMEPCVDNKPFFFNFAKGFVPTLRLVYPYLIVVIVALLGAGCLILAQGHGGLPVAGGESAVVLLLGIGFMLIELGLLQKLVMAAGGPTKMMSIVLFSILFGCGLGAQLASRLTDRFGWSVQFYCLMVAVANAGLILWVGPHPERMVVTGVSPWLVLPILLAPVSLLLGGPLPVLLRRYGRQDPRLLGFLWAINGLGSVAGACMALVLMLTLGIDETLWAGSFLYGGAACFTWRWFEDVGKRIEG